MSRFETEGGPEVICRLVEHRACRPFYRKGLTVDADIAFENEHALDYVTRAHRLQNGPKTIVERQHMRDAATCSAGQHNLPRETELRQDVEE